MITVLVEVRVGRIVHQWTCETESQEILQTKLQQKFPTMGIQVHRCNVFSEETLLVSMEKALKGLRKRATSA